MSEELPKLERHSEEHTSRQIQHIGDMITKSAIEVGDFGADTYLYEPETKSTTTTVTFPDQRGEGAVRLTKIRHQEQVRDSQGRLGSLDQFAKIETDKSEVHGDFEEAFHRDSASEADRPIKYPLLNKEVRGLAADIFWKQRKELGAKKQKRQEFIKS